jgi:ABC-2 type transport system ATP-binding protein
MSVVAHLAGVDLRLGRRFDLSVAELTFGPGVTAVVGTNGSGKTTLLRLVATVLSPDAGTITVGGHDTTTPAGLVATRRLLGYLPQHDTVPGRLSVFDHVDLVAVMRELPGSTAVRRRAVGRAIRAVGLAAVATERCGRLSGGQRRSVAIAAALAGDPELLVLDEPDAHLDDAHREDLGRRLRGHSATVVLSTHDRQWASEVADRVVELRDGRVVNRR